MVPSSRWQTRTSPVPTALLPPETIVPSTRAVAAKNGQADVRRRGLGGGSVDSMASASGPWLLLDYRSWVQSLSTHGDGGWLEEPRRPVDPTPRYARHRDCSVSGAGVCPPGRKSQADGIHEADRHRDPPLEPFPRPNTCLTSEDMPPAMSDDFDDEDGPSVCREPVRDPWLHFTITSEGVPAATSQRTCWPDRMSAGESRSPSAARSRTVSGSWTSDCEANPDAASLLVEDLFRRRQRGDTASFSGGCTRPPGRRFDGYSLLVQSVPRFCRGCERP